MKSSIYSSELSKLNRAPQILGGESFETNNDITVNTIPNKHPMMECIYGNYYAKD